MLAGSYGHWPKRSVSKLQQSSRTSAKLFSTRPDCSAMFLVTTGSKAANSVKQMSCVQVASEVRALASPEQCSQLDAIASRFAGTEAGRLQFQDFWAKRGVHQVPPQPDFEQADAQPQAAPAPSAPAFRLRSTGCLFTWNGLSLNPMIFQEFVAWIHTLEFVYRFSATVERPAGTCCTDSEAFEIICFGSPARSWQVAAFRRATLPLPCFFRIPAPC